jgi:hypothetical protein
VRGKLQGCGRVTFSLAGKPSCTEYRVVQHTHSALCGTVTTVDMWPHTGRTHQLRKHLAMIGHPILGDVLYWRSGCSHAACGGAPETREHIKIEPCELQDELSEGASLVSPSRCLDFPLVWEGIAAIQHAQCDSSVPSSPKKHKSESTGHANRGRSRILGRELVKRGCLKKSEGVSVVGALVEEDSMQDRPTGPLVCSAQARGSVEHGQGCEPCSRADGYDQRLLCSSQEEAPVVATSNQELGRVGTKRRKELRQDINGFGVECVVQSAIHVPANIGSSSPGESDIGVAQMDGSERSQQRCSSSPACSAHAMLATKHVFLEAVNVKTIGRSVPSCDVDGEATNDVVISESNSEESAGCTQSKAEFKRAKQDEAMAERMCLWKLQCCFVHPRTMSVRNICIDEPGLFDRVRKAHNLKV